MCICDRMKGIICAAHKHERDERYPAPQPLTWELPAEPGREVDVVRDASGCLWDREPNQHDGLQDVWRYRMSAASKRVGLVGSTANWAHLLMTHGPLTDASAEAVSGDH